MSDNKVGIDYVNLIKRAADAASRAYTPYSKFNVGAALLAANGEIYTGCNIENSSYSATVCAERVAFFKAICDGVRDFTAIAVVNGIVSGEINEGDVIISDKECFPCGVCRQVMAEFCSSPEFEIILGSQENYHIYKLQQLLPHAFSL